MSFIDNGADDWITPPVSAPASAAGADDWITPTTAAAPAYQPNLIERAGDVITAIGTAGVAGAAQNEYAQESAKGFIEGGKNLGASALKGYGAQAPILAEKQLQALDQLNQPLAEDATPEERAAYRTRRFVHPTDEVINARRQALEQTAATPVVEQPLYRAGQAVEDFGKEALAARPGWEESWTRDIASGAGSMVAGMGASMVPGVGPAIAGATFIGAGAGEAADKAIKEGANEQQIRQASEYGNIAGATDVVDMLLPHLGSTGKTLGFVRRVGTRAILGAFAEGGQEGVQQLIQNQIALHIYKPDQDWLEDVPRSIAIGMILGFGAGGAFSAAEGGRAHQPASGATQVPSNGPEAAPTGLQAAPNATNAPSSIDLPPGALPADTVLPSEFAGEPVPTSPTSSIGEVAPAAAATNIPGNITTPAGIPGTPPPPQGEGLTEAVTPPPTPPGADASGRHTLQQIFDDPRSADEIRAEIAAARNWQPTQDWQPVPQGAQLAPELETRTEGDQTFARIAPAPGTREAPVRLESPADVSAGAEITNPTPTPAQVESGVYQKRHLKWQGLDISIETEAGAERVAKDGSWRTTMPVPYGHILGTKGADGDPLDISIGPNPKAPSVFVIDQVDPDSRVFDETKSFQGFNSADAAQAAYDASFSDGSGPFRAGAITEMSVAQFKAWARNGDHAKPVAYKAPVQKRAARRGPLSLFEFLAQRGGIRDHGGELRHMGLTHKFIPGFGRLVRATGMDLDRAREAAVEAGYIYEPGDHDGGVAVTTVNDLLNLIDTAHRGQKVYSEEDRQEVADRENARIAKEMDAQLKAATQDVRATAKAQGFANLTDDEVKAAARLVVEQRDDALDAIFHIVDQNAIQFESARAESAARERGGNEQAAPVERPRTAVVGGEAAQASQQRPGPQAAGPAGSAPPVVEPPRSEHGAGEEGPAATAGAGERAAEPAGGVTFRTAKGSTYTVHEDGTTTRNKAARSDPGHEGDSGPKERSARTIYLDNGTLAAQLSAAGLQGPVKARVVIRSGRAGLLIWNDKVNNWGWSSPGEGIPFSTEPAAGKAPLELWKPASDVPDFEAYRGMHAGNVITDITPRHGAPTTEATPAGDQHVLPGAERISAAEETQRKANEKLKPKVAQKAADVGLFSDQAAQSDLVDLARKAPAPAVSANHALANTPEKSGASEGVDLKRNTPPAEDAPVTVQKASAPPGVPIPAAPRSGAREMYAPPDPLDLAMSGRLSSATATEIAAKLKASQDEIENQIFGDKAKADQWRKLHRNSDRAWDNARDADAKEYDRQISELEAEAKLSAKDEEYLDGQGWPEHSDPDAWKNLARSLKDIENGRPDAVQASASALRYIPRTNDWSKMDSREQESVITILTAMNEETKAGRSADKFLKDVYAARIRRYGGGPDAVEVAQAQIDDLAKFMREGIQREGAPPQPALPASDKAKARETGPSDSGNEELASLFGRRGGGPRNSLPGIIGRTLRRLFGVSESKTSVPDGAAAAIPFFRQYKLPLQFLEPGGAANVNFAPGRAKWIENEPHNPRLGIGGSETPYEKAVAGREKLPAWKLKQLRAQQRAIIDRAIKEGREEFTPAEVAKIRAIDDRLADGAPDPQANFWFLTNDLGHTIADVYGHWDGDAQRYTYVAKLWKPSGPGSITPAAMSPAFGTASAAKQWAEAYLAIGRQLGDIHPGDLPHTITDTWSAETKQFIADHKKANRGKEPDLTTILIHESEPEVRRLEAERAREKIGPVDSDELSQALTPAARRRQRDIERTLSDLVTKMVGRDTAVRFVQSIDATGEAEGYGDFAKYSRPDDVTSGHYLTADRVITIALSAPDARLTAFHEAWHDIEFHLLKQSEIDLLKRETDRLRPIVAEHLGLSKEAVAELDGFEVRAYAFQAYAQAREQGKTSFGTHTGVARILGRILHFFRQVRNALQGMGFRTTEDLFEQGRGGKLSERPDLGTRHTSELASAITPKGRQGPLHIVIKPGDERGHVVFGAHRSEASARAQQNELLRSEWDREQRDNFDDVEDREPYPGSAEAYREANKDARGEFVDYNGRYPDLYELDGPIEHDEVYVVSALNSAQDGVDIYGVYGSQAEATKRQDEVARAMWAENGREDYESEYFLELPEGVRLTAEQMDGVPKEPYPGLKKALQYFNDTEPAGPRVTRAKVQGKAAAGETLASAITPATPAPARAMVASIPNEIIADQLDARNLPKLARISRTLKLGNANTTEVRTQVQDKFIRWHKIQDAVERATGQKLSEDMNVYMAESLYYGRTGERLEELEREHIDPLIDEIKKRGLTLEDVNRFLMARHAPERNAKLKDIIPQPDLAGTPAGHIESPSGMSDAEAKRILDAIDASGKRADYDAVERRVRKLIDETRIALLSGGLINKATLDTWDAAYKNYVPLRGFADEAEVEAPHAGFGKGFDVRGEESKRALGRKSLADGPLSYVLLQAQQAIIRAEKAKVGRTAMRFVNANPMPELWEINKGETKRAIDPATGLVTMVDDPLWRFKPNVFSMKIDGVPYYINFKGEHGNNLARALKNLGTANLHPAMRLIAALTRLQARLATSWNPDFMIPNFVRDLGEAFINMQEQDQKKFTKQFAKHLFPAMRGAFQALTGQAGGKHAQAFREFDKAGGRIRFFGMEDVEDIKANVASKMRRLEGGAVNNLRAAGEKAAGAIEIANATIENATRLAAFMAARDVGLSPAKAASIAREMTVNFNRKGELGSAISAAYLFANASMQGTVRMMGALRGSKKVRRAAYAIAAAGAALALYNIGAGGDDEDEVPFYLKIPPWVRDTNIIIMWPKGLGHDGSYVKIPLPYGYSFFHVIGARLTGLALGKEKPGKAIGAVAASVLDAFDPLGKDENLLAQFTPSILRPAVHLATNKNWTGRPINPEPTPFNKHEPNSSRNFRSASPFSVGAAQKANALTGGTKHEPGMVDVSPGTIDYMLKFVTGGLGQFAMNTVTTAWGAYQGTEWQVDKTPIVRRFFGQVDEAADRATYFEEREKATNALKRLEAFGKDDDTKNFERLLREGGPEISAGEMFKAADEYRAFLLKEIDDIKADDKLSAREKERRIKLKEKEELDLMNDMRKQLRDARKAAGHAAP